MGSVAKSHLGSHPTKTIIHQHTKANTFSVGYVLPWNLPPPACTSMEIGLPHKSPGPGVRRRKPSAVGNWSASLRRGCCFGRFPTNVAQHTVSPELFSQNWVIVYENFLNYMQPCRSNRVFQRCWLNVQNLSYLVQGSCFIFLAFQLTVLLRSSMGSINQTDSRTKTLFFCTTNALSIERPGFNLGWNSVVFIWGI